MRTTAALPTAMLRAVAPLIALISYCQTGCSADPRHQLIDGYYFTGDVASGRESSYRFVNVLSSGGGGPYELVRVNFRDLAILFRHPTRVEKVKTTWRKGVLTEEERSSPEPIAWLVDGVVLFRHFADRPQHEVDVYEYWLSLTPAERDASPGVHRLRGQLDFRRLEPFDANFDMVGVDDPTVVFRGRLYFGRRTNPHGREIIVKRKAD